jgi:hypothetical protein
MHGILTEGEGSSVRMTSSLGKVDLQKRKKFKSAHLNELVQGQPHQGTLTEGKVQLTS